jgi:hypothetical protein
MIRIFHMSRSSRNPVVFHGHCLSLTNGNTLFLSVTNENPPVSSRTYENLPCCSRTNRILPVPGRPMKIFHVVLGTNENLELDCQGIPLSNTTQTYGSTLTSTVSVEYETIKGICQAFLLSYELGQPPPPPRGLYASVYLLYRE